MAMNMMSKKEQITKYLEEIIPQISEKYTDNINIKNICGPVCQYCNVSLKLIVASQQVEQPINIGKYNVGTEVLIKIKPVLAWQCTSCGKIFELTIEDTNG